jgi:transcriptional regulator with XRE-family HTH domain
MNVVQIDEGRTGGVVMAAPKKAKQNGTPQRLKKYRMDAGFSIYSLADRIDVNYSTVSNWENGLKFPRPAKMMLLENLFGVGYRELFSPLTAEENTDLERRRLEDMRKKNKKQSN